MTEELGRQLLEQAEELLEKNGEQERLLQTLELAEKVLPEDVEVLCRSAKILFRFSLLNSKGRFLLPALDKLNSAQEKNPEFFESNPLWNQLWGNILVQLGKLVDDASFFEKALEKYSKAAEIVAVHDFGLYWDWADAWLLLAGLSGETTDIQQGLAKFHIADQVNPCSPFFHLDYGNALCQYGKMTGQPQVIDEAMVRFQRVLAHEKTSDNDTLSPSVFALRKQALASKLRYELTHDWEDLDKADVIFRDALLISPRNGELWLDWGELYLHAGWLKRNVKLVETGLEKLTSLKVSEYDSLRQVALLSLGLSIYGLFLENLKLIKDGSDRIKTALKKNPENSHLRFAGAFIDSALAIYFSDRKAFIRAVRFFEKELVEDATSVKNLHALFQTYFSWGLAENDPLLIKKGIAAISRLCALRPFSSAYLNDWGVALLRLKQYENDKEACQLYVEEAIQCFRKAWELAEDDETLYNWGCAYDILGDITADEEDYAKAIDLLTKAFEKKPSDLYVRYHLGLALSHLGELMLLADCLMQAIDLLDSVAKAEQEDENVWCDLGYAYLNLSELVFDPAHPDEGLRLRKEAERALMRAAEFGSGEACYHLACLYSLCEMYDASMQYLQKAKATDRLPSREDLEHDEWLDGVRKTDAFQDFLTLQDQDG